MTRKIAPHPFPWNYRPRSGLVKAAQRALHAPGIQGTDPVTGDTFYNQLRIALAKHRKGKG